MGAIFSAPSGFKHSDLVPTFEQPLAEKYDVVKQIGSGRYGNAFLVRSKTDSHSSFVAKEALEKSDAAFQELHAEFNRWKDLQHPNISKVVALITGKDNHIYVISELAKGGDLYQYMSSLIDLNQELTEQWVAGVFKQAMSGVAYMHDNGIVHNDLKPENILCLEALNPKKLDRVPWVALNDFGSARFRADTQLSSGDPRYLSPETLQALSAEIKGEATDYITSKVGFESDVWSMGVTLYELLSGGTIPFLYEPCEIDMISSDPHKWERLKTAVLTEELRCSPFLDGSSPEAVSLLGQLLCKDRKRRPPAAQVLENTWFSSKGKPIKSKVLANLQFKKFKGTARTVLLNALATKLKRDHYKDCYRVFNAVDADNSGHISLQEFTIALHALPHQSPSSSNTAPTSEGEGSMAEILFRAADVDNDGRLNFLEFMASSFDWSSLDADTLSQSLKQLFDQVDKDGNGRLSLEELTGLFKEALYASEIQEVFARLDRAGSGYITLDELRAFLFQPLSERQLNMYCGAESLTQLQRRRLRSGGAFTTCVAGICKLA